MVCLTQDNLEAPWLLFEAGALSKSVGNSRVVPYLYGVTQASLKGPLSQFQAAVADKVSTLRVLNSINEASEGSGLDPARLAEACDMWWPELKQKLDSIPAATEEAPPTRTDRDMLEEILLLCRQISRQGGPSLSARANLWRPLLDVGPNTESADSPVHMRSENSQTLAELFAQKLLSANFPPASEKGLRSDDGLDDKVQT